MTSKAGPGAGGDVGPDELDHHLEPLAGRDPHERGRVASPLELLFDLTFAVAFSTAGGELAHLVASGHATPALLGFGFAMFAIIWAWINFTWFASAFDTDDWLYRLTTMVQMTGVIILALGLPAMFTSIEEGHFLNNRVMVFGYVIMRVAMIFQWIRAYVACPHLRRGIIMYIVSLGVAQVGWVIVAIVHMQLLPTLLVGACLMAIELLGPILGERRAPTPWHAHHIAERYSLLAIIALGEGVIGTVASLSAAISHNGWTIEAALIVLSGIGVTFGLWWVYFGVPFANLLHVHRNRSFGFGYLHIVLFASIAAVGAGLHVAGYYLEGEATIPEHTVVAALLAPVGLFIVVTYAIYYFMARRFDGWAHALEFVAGMVLLAVAYAAALAHVGLGWCLLIVALAPASIAAGYELIGHRGVARMLADEQRTAS